MQLRGRSGLREERTRITHSRETLVNITRLRVARLCAVLLSVLLPVAAADAQDRVHVFGNSIVWDPTIPFFQDLVEQTGAPRPFVVAQIAGNQTTTSFVNLIGSITGAPQPWRAMIVCGGTRENLPTVGNPQAFQSNMLTLGAALFGHSPNAQFVAHETGADHPDDTVYPGLVPNAETWLAYSHAAYATAAAAITAAHPGNLPVRVAEQGTCWAATAGYPTFLYQNDLHHLSPRGKLLSAMLWYIAIYGGRIENIPVDFTSSTPLVTRLIANGIDEAEWRRLVGFADNSQPPAARPYPGSNGDFQLRSAVNSTITNLMTRRTATAGSTLRLEPFSPLGAAANAPAYIYSQILPTGLAATGGLPPELWLDANVMRLVFKVPDLSGAPVDITIPPGLLGYTIWVQAISGGPGTGPGNRIYSDAQLVDIQ